MKTSAIPLLCACLLAATNSVAASVVHHAPTLTPSKAFFERLVPMAPKKKRIHRYKHYSTLLRERAQEAEAAQERFPPAASLAFFAPLLFGAGYLGLKGSKKDGQPDKSEALIPRAWLAMLDRLRGGQHSETDGQTRGAA